MAVFKCKMCGGTLEINNNESVAVCEYCGTKQTLPKLDDEKKVTLYERANHFRRNNEFDKAMGIYEQILNEVNTDAESYWSLVLCRYGIEYVEDPVSHKHVPTVNRAQFTSIFDDEDYKSAIKYADSYQKELYEQEAKQINEIQKGILAISQQEEPFDVFICYKETDDNGKRTPDSVLATELYHELTREGYKVFFSRITLEDKLGTAYEPYIFAAINSAKVMVVLGTKPELFNAPWVKNEWCRYLSLIKNGAKKMLIPAYKDMNPYDLPEEFSHLQAQDIGKLGFMQDLIRGIKKMTQKDESQSTFVKETIVTSSGVNISSLLERAFLFLEDGNFIEADKYCEKVLDQDPKCAEAYLCKLMVDLKVQSKANLSNCENLFDDNVNYQKIIRFGDAHLIDEMKNIRVSINERKEIARLERERQEEIARQKAQKRVKLIKKIAIIAIPIIAGIIVVIMLFNSVVLPNIKLNNAMEMISEKDYDSAYVLLEELNEIDTINSSKYAHATELFDAKEYEPAMLLFNQIQEYKDSANKINECNKEINEYKYNKALAHIEHENYEEAYKILIALDGYKNSKDLIKGLTYKKAEALYNSKDYSAAIEILSELGDYGNSKELLATISKEIKDSASEKINIDSYIECTVEELYENPYKYDGKKVVITSWKVICKHNFETVVGTFYDFLLCDDLTYYEDKSDYPVVPVYSYYKDCIQPFSVPYIGCRVFSDVIYNDVSEDKKRITVYGTFTYNSNTTEGDRYIGDPHVYDIDVDYYIE